LDRLAGALLELETLDRNGVEAALRGNEVPPPDLENAPEPNAERQEGEDAPVLNPKPGVLPA
jgi:hypothetical protein